MMQLLSHYIGVAQGDDVIFSDYSDGGDMWTGEGPRERIRKILFKSPFKAPPLVHVSLTMWDIDSAGNARADVVAEKITRTGFKLVFRTWADTRVARARIGWMAIGEVVPEEDWEV